MILDKDYNKKRLAVCTYLNKVRKLKT